MAKLLAILAIVAIAGYFAVAAVGRAIDQEYTDWKCRTDFECYIEDYENPTP